MPPPAGPPVAPAATSPKGRLRPLSELPQQRLAPLLGLLTDIDDTLTREGSIEPEALAALHALRAAGLVVIAITGRPTQWSEPFVHAWPVAAIVAENGGVMLRLEHGRLRLDYTTDDATRAANAQRMAACAAAVQAEVSGAALARDSAGRLTDIAIDHSEFSHLDDARIAQVVAVMRRHGLTATVSSIHINGWIGGHSKWTGAHWAVQALTGEALQPDRWLYVGDSTNDQEMFERLPLTVAVANIARFVPQLRALPGYVTAAERGRGFAEVAQAVLEAKPDGEAKAAGDWPHGSVQAADPSDA